MLEVFPICFWNYTNCNIVPIEEGVQDWKKLGMSFAMTSEMKKDDEKAYIFATLDEAYKNGIKVIVCDYRTRWTYLTKNGVEAYKTAVENAVKDFGSHPAFYAFHVGDEPGKAEWEDMQTATKIVNAVSNAFVNFFPMFDEDFEERVGTNHEGYLVRLEETVKATGLKMLSYDFYSQLNYYEREEGLNEYFKNLNGFRKVADKCNVPLFTSLLSVGHWVYRVPNADDIRWQISTAVAHGVNGIFWFYLYERYKESSYRFGPIDLFYEKTETFNYLSRENRIFAEYLADKFVGAKLKKVYHYGKTYAGTDQYAEGKVKGLEITTKFIGELIISEFTDRNGKDFVAIVNNRQSDIELIRGKYLDKPFHEFLSPGQIIIMQ